MKIYTPLFIIVLLFSACQKELEPFNPVVEATSPTYETLGDFNQEGKPGYLVTPDVISSDLTTFITNTFPENQDLRNSNPGLLAGPANGDISITQSSEVFLTFVTQGTVYKNTIAFYTYPTNTPPDSVNDIKTITYIFPNAGGGTPLLPGDKVRIGRFGAGTSIGFVLLKDAYNNSTHKINNSTPHYSSNDILNPEVNSDLKKHAVLVDYPTDNIVLIGFEDIDRTLPGCDHDFNDVVVYATIKR